MEGYVGRYRGKLRRSLGLGAGQVLVAAAGVVHRPPDHRIRADPGQERVDGLLDCPADLDGLHLDVSAQIWELQHRHHAVDRHDGDTVHHGVPRRRQLRVCRQSIDGCHGQQGVFHGGFDRLQRMRCQGELRRPGDVGKARAADGDFTAVLPRTTDLLRDDASFFASRNCGSVRSSFRFSKTTSTRRPTFAAVAGASSRLPASSAPFASSSSIMMLA
jgi:hypothetical protein